MEIPQARRHEIALAMVAAMREQEKQGAAANISPPGIKVLLELFDERAEEIAKLREENGRLVDKVVAAEERQLTPGELEDRSAEAETDQRTIASLRKDLEEERAWNNRLRAQLEELRAWIPVNCNETNVLRERVAQLELAAKRLQGIVEDCARLKATAERHLERAFDAERQLGSEREAHGATRLELAAAMNDRSLLELRLNDMAERFADLSELVLQEDNGPGVVVIELGVQIL